MKRETRRRSGRMKRYLKGRSINEVKYQERRKEVKEEARHKKRKIRD